MKPDRSFSVGRGFDSAYLHCPCGWHLLGDIIDTDADHWISLKRLHGDYGWLGRLFYCPRPAEEHEVESVNVRWEMAS